MILFFKFINCNFHKLINTNLMNGGNATMKQKYTVQTMTCEYTIRHFELPN